MEIKPWESIIDVNTVASFMRSPYVKSTLCQIETGMDDRCGEHTFSIELKSKDHVKTITLTNKIQNRILLEGSLGVLEEITLIEGRVMELKGVSGTLRLDICEDELIQLLKPKKKRIWPRQFDDPWSRYHMLSLIRRRRKQ